MTRGLLAVLVLPLLSCAAAAQDDLPFGGRVVIPPSQAVWANPPLQAGYRPRAAAPVYDNLTNVLSNGSSIVLGNCNQVLEDISFQGGPWALPYAAPRIVTGCTVGVSVSGSASDSSSDRFFLVFWNTNDTNFEGTAGTGTNMIRAGASPVAAYIFDPGTLGPGFLWQLVFNGLNVVVPPDANGLTVQAGWLSAAAGTPADWSNLSGLLRETCPSAGLRGLAFGSNSRQPLGGNPATVGSTLPDYGRDALTSSPNSCCDNAGVFRGGPLSPTPPCNEHRSVTTGQFASGFQVILLGDVITYHEEPPLGLISDPGALFARTLPPNSTRFYSFDIAGDATDLALHFLDIDTEASETDVAMGIFDSNGNLIASDDNSGSGTNAQLSFGVGRRAGVGDGQQYDGRSGQLAAGTYYLAVGSSGTTFADGFTATPGNGPGGDFTLNFHTNVNGTPLAPSVPPLIPANHDFDAVFGPVDPNQPGGVVRQLPPANTGINGVIWDRFALAGPIDSSHFLTLAYDAPLNATAYIFNSTGSLVYAVGPQIPPRFDIGGNGPFNPPEASAGLPAGTYYLATALSPTDDLRAVPPGGRWHVRGRSASNAELSATLYAGQAPPTCNPDVNQDGATDQGDVDYLINALAGGGNPNNIDTDFNQDGASDQGDIDALINVVAGGQCP